MIIRLGVKLPLNSSASLPAGELNAGTSLPRLRQDSEKPTFHQRLIPIMVQLRTSFRQKHGRRLPPVVPGCRLYILRAGSCLRNECKRFVIPPSEARNFHLNDLWKTGLAPLPTTTHFANFLIKE